MSDALHEGWRFEVVDVPEGGVRIGRTYADNGSLRAAGVFLRMANAATASDPSGTDDGMPFWEDDRTLVMYSASEWAHEITIWVVNVDAKRVMFDLTVPKQAIEAACMDHDDVVSSARSTAIYAARALAQIGEPEADRFLEGLGVLVEEHRDGIDRLYHDLRLATPWTTATRIDRRKPEAELLSDREKDALREDGPKRIAMLLDDIGTKGMRITIAPYGWRTDIPSYAPATMRAVAMLPDGIRSIFST